MVLEVLQKQQKSLEELMSSIRDLKQTGTQTSSREWNGQRPNIVCFKCNRKGHIASNCKVKDDRYDRRGSPQGSPRPNKSVN